MVNQRRVELDYNWDRFRHAHGAKKDKNERFVRVCAVQRMNRGIVHFSRPAPPPRTQLAARSRGRDRLSFRRDQAGWCRHTHQHTHTKSPAHTSTRRHTHTHTRCTQRLKHTSTHTPYSYFAVEIRYNES